MGGEKTRAGWTELMQVPDPVEAELVRGRLDFEGVEVVVEPVSFGELPLPANEDFSAIRIWVPEAEVGRARRVLEQKVLPSELEREARESAPPAERED